MKRILIVTVLLAAGVLLNIGVAWTCAVCINLDSFEGEGEYWEGQVIFRQNAPGRSFILWDRHPFSRDPQTINSLESLLPRIPSYLRREIRTAEVANEAWYADAAGWPMYSLWRESRLTLGQPRATVLGGIELSLPPWRPHYPRALPLRPILAGFAFDTLFYSSALALVTMGPHAFRRLVRLRRHCCTKCGYPIGDSAACPECGATLSPPRGVV